MRGITEVAGAALETAVGELQRSVTAGDTAGPLRGVLPREPRLVHNTSYAMYLTLLGSYVA